MKCKSGNFHCPNPAKKDGYCLPHWYANNQRLVTVYELNNLKENE